jgi:integrase/recombinase XerD
VRGTELELLAPAVPTRVPERLDTLDALAAGWLMRFGANTRDAYARDLRSWLAWCDELEVDPLHAGLHHADAYSRWLTEIATTRTGGRLAPSSVNRRMSALASFYRYCVRQRALTESPFFEVARPAVSGDSTTTGLSRDELRRLVDVAQADSARSGALVALLAFNGLRITEALSRDVEHLTYDEGHRVLRIERKGGKRAVTPLAPPVVRALDAYVGDRTAGPIFTTSTGQRMTRSAAYRVLQCLARRAEIPAAAAISPHSARHAFATLALDAGVPLRDVQDAMGHTDPRTTRRYDRSRHSLDRHATYVVAAYLATEASP